MTNFGQPRQPSTRRIYAGIGSRHAPAWALQLAEMVAERLDELNWTLRSGHAPGMDQAFECGAGRNAEIYLPWPTFEQSEPLSADVIVDRPSDAAYELAAQHHPHWAALTRGGRALQARNCHQVLGRDLASPAAFVLCWTSDGSLDGRGRGAGGTGQALRLAAALGVPRFNLERPEHRYRIEALLHDATVSS